MKKITKTTKKNKPFAPKTVPCQFDITHVDTDAEMIYTIAYAKLMYGKSINFSEFTIMHTFNAEAQAKVFDCIMNTSACIYCELKNSLEWANRPWYKKLLFWKKKPTCKCKECKLF